MKLNRLYLQNFRSHRESEALGLDRVNYFLGRNNAGKSSILAAIEWCLTGSCSWTDKAGRGAAELIRGGAKSATVFLELDAHGPAIRTMNPNSFTFAGDTGGATSSQFKLNNALETDELAMKAALNAFAFVEMPAADQKNFLFTVLGLRWDIGLVEAALREWAKVQKYDDEKINQLAASIRPLYPPRLTAGPEVLDAIEKRIKETRRDTNRDLKQIKAARAELVIERPAVDANLDEITEQIAEVRAERDNLLTMLADRKRSADRQKALYSEYTALMDRLEQIKDAYGRLAAQAPVTPFAKADQAAVDRAQTAYQAHAVKLADQEATHRALVTALKALQGTDGRCPLAPAHIKCAMTNSARTKLLADLDAQAVKLAGEITGTKNDQEFARQELNNQKALIERIRQAERAAQQAEQEKAKLKAQGEELTRRTNELAAELKKYQALQAPDMSPITALDARISQGEKFADQLKAIEAAKAKAEQQDADIATLTAESAALEILVKAFGADGIRRHVLSKNLDPFMERVNDRLARLTEGQYRAELDPDMSIAIMTPTDRTQIRLLSTSERLRVGIAFQEAISAYIGLRFLAVDGADLLDQENRDLLTGALLDLMEGGEFEQAFVFSTIGDVQPSNPGIEGFKMFLVDSGTISEI